MFRRDKGHTLSSFIGDEAKIEEELEDEEVQDYTDYKRPQLDPISQGIIP